MTVANVSSFGIQATLISTVTFPYGFQLTKFPDDSDPIQVDDLTVKAFEMLMDGRLITFQVAKPVQVAISVIPGSNDDINLGVILSATQIRAKLIPIPDILILMISYPDGTISTLTSGAMISGPPARSVTSAGRLKTNTYKFVFGESTNIGSSLIGSVAGIGATGANIIGRGGF